MTQYEQSTLIAAALSADPALSAPACTALYNYSLRRAYPIARRILYRRPAHEIEDLAHRAATAAILRLAQFRHQSQYDTWLHRIAVRVTLMEVRRLRSGSHGLLDRAESLDMCGTGENTEEAGITMANRIAVTDPAVAWLEAADALQHGTADLPLKYITLLHLRLDGWDENEIAAQCGLTISTVKARMHFVRKKVRVQLGLATTRVCAENEERGVPSQ